MRRMLFSAAVAAVLVPFWAVAQAPAPPTPPAAGDKVNADEVIAKFAAKEKQFQEARNNYTYRQSLKFQELDPSGNPSGHQWEQVSDIIFTPEGRRMEKMVYAPVQTLTLLLTPEDLADLIYVQPFVLTTDQIPDYDINYIGREKIDEISTYVFSVRPKPKKMVKGKRYFEGQAWVDDRDLQIVKTYGKGVGTIKENKDNQFPRFSTYREQIDGKYWFPTYTFADDTLHFRDSSQRVKLVIRYQDYKKYEGKSSIKFGDVVDDKTTPPTKKK
jgi:hypothetical protein